MGTIGNTLYIFMIILTWYVLVWLEPGKITSTAQRLQSKPKCKRNAQPMTPVADLFEEDEGQARNGYPWRSNRAPMFSDYTKEMWYNPPK